MSLPLLDDVRALSPAIRELAPLIEQDRGVPPALIEQLAELGIFRLAAPKELGGLEADPASLVEIFEELGHADGSTGWCAMIAGATSMALAYLDPATAADLLRDPRFLIAGVAAPMGRATPADGGYRVSGRWSFASACHHATALVGGVVTPAGVRLAVLDPADVAILDTWEVAGLRGTGSHDFTADDVLVPAGRTFSLAEPPHHDGPLYAFPALSLLALGIGAVALGIARAAIGDFGALARTKRNPVTGETISTRPAVRAAVAEATALHGSGLAYLLASVRATGSDARRRAALRLAISTATRNAARAVDLVYHAAGGSAVYDASPLQRHFRDVHVATQHAMVSSDVTETAGAVLLGDTTVPTARL
ncbi:acyl-CoA dehydrogenase family protein [Pseudosporangium ferrugineum]|uniref:Alkylation response protein AidB-like acyl-CoA dehydrogenase n=1 Tax=Pseudosporangium ferrugineum TaxID=439699 RepID=A0A2T0RDA2_9ACTN|nr:acyl-CoA dehydrogenase family protein [Pseudosporangium ferrugineum]PRY19145.1 alkylation response protein AidB-like acyl-CoA dehydrogenase [Pseudosporangium ferrugineum]